MILALLHLPALSCVRCHGKTTPCKVNPVILHCEYNPVQDDRRDFTLRYCTALSCPASGAAPQVPRPRERRDQAQTLVAGRGEACTPPPSRNVREGGWGWRSPSLSSATLPVPCSGRGQRPSERRAPVVRLHAILNSCAFALVELRMRFRNAVAIGSTIHSYFRDRRDIEECDRPAG